MAREHGPNLLRCHGNRLPHWPRLVPIRACRWRPLGREGREEGGGRRRRPRPVLSPRDHGSHLVRSPTWKEFPPTTGLPPRGAAVSQTHSRCQPGRPVVVPGDPECPVNSLRPARCPRKCWAAAKPRPAPPARFRELSGGAVVGFAATARRSRSPIQQPWTRCYPALDQGPLPCLCSPRRPKYTGLHPL